MNPKEYKIPSNATKEQKKVWRDFLLKLDKAEKSFLKATNYVIKNGMPCDGKK
jgi:hypothetical protein